MHYKINLHQRLEEKQIEFQNRFPNKSINLPSLNVVSKLYSYEDEEKIIEMKNVGYADKEIARRLERSYWGLVDKIRRLRIEGRL